MESKTELAKLELYKSQLLSLKDSLTDVPPEYYTKDWKEIPPNIGKLQTYLDNNNCLNEQDFGGCYRENRLLLIATTKELDASNERINGLNKIVDKLIENVNAIIDNLNTDGNPTTIEKIKSSQVVKTATVVTGQSAEKVKNAILQKE